MIVKCDKCQTRFKIPDEKVTEKGVKVRCTKCQHTFRVARAPEAAVPAPVALPPAPASKPPVDTDPFAQFGLGSAAAGAESTRPGFFVEGVNATRAENQPLQPVFSAQQDVPSDLFEQPTRVGPMPKEIREHLKAMRGEVAPTPARSFDPSELFADPPAPPPPPAPSAASLQSLPPPQNRPSRPATDFELTNPTAASYDPFAGVPDAPSPFEPLGADAPAAPTATQTSAGLLGDLPPPPDESFGGLDADPFASGEGPGLGAEPDRRLFDMPAANPPAPIEQQPTQQLPRPSMSPPPPQPPPPVMGAAVAKPAGRPEDMGMAEPRAGGAVRRGLGWVVNLAVGALLVLGVLTVGTIYLNEGKVDPSAISLEPVKALFSAPSALVAVDVSNGLYDTQSGRPVFYVRGEAENRGDTPERLQVSVQILDGALVLTEAAVLAGSAPTPEDLFGVTGPKELAALNARLDKEAKLVQPGERAPFLVAFYEFPPELTQYRLKVTVQKAPAATAER